MTATADQAAAVRTRDLRLDALTVSSGAVDAISFIALGKVFTAFMTGNLVFLGMRVAGAPAPSVATILASLGAFSCGVLLSTRIVASVQASSTWPRQVTLALGASLIAHAGFLVVWLLSNGQPAERSLPALLAFWGLAMGMQSGAVRALHVEGVFTTAATATVIYLAGAILSWPATVLDRRRLANVLVSLVIGATVGALLLLRVRVYAPLLPFAITAVVVATAARTAPSRASRGIAAGRSG
jgi:uncharacterized membrane protein YoaK (UPF0700 family)